MTKMDESNTGSRPNPMGIPGSRSNLPGTETNNPQVPMASSNNEKNSSSASYAIPRKVQVIDKPSGSIKRLTVAVVVDGYYTKAPNSTVENFAPRTEEELKRLQELVANAVGFDADRRDSITVSSLPFSSQDLKQMDPEVSPTFQWTDLRNPMVRNGLIALVVLSFLFLVLRPFLKWMSLAKREEAMDIGVAMTPQTVEELQAAVGAMQREKGTAMEAEASLSGDTSNLIAQMEKNDQEDNKVKDLFADTEAKKEEKRLRNLIVEKMEKSPKKGFLIIQEWLEEEVERRSAEVAA